MSARAEISDDCRPNEPTRNVIVIPDCTGDLHIGTCAALTDVVGGSATRAEIGSQAARQGAPSRSLLSESPHVRRAEL